MDPAYPPTLGAAYPSPMSQGTPAYLAGGESYPGASSSYGPSFTHPSSAGIGIGSGSSAGTASASMASAALMGSGAALREDLIQSAVRFLQNPEVTKSAPSTRVVFLEKKGLTASEIAEALRRSMPLAPETALVAAAASKGQSASAAVAPLLPDDATASIAAAGLPAAPTMSTSQAPGMVQLGPSLFAHPSQLFPGASSAAAASVAAVARRSPRRAGWLSSLLTAAAVVGSAAAAIGVTKHYLLGDDAAADAGSGAGGSAASAKSGSAPLLTHVPAPTPATAAPVAAPALATAPAPAPGPATAAGPVRGFGGRGPGTSLGDLVVETQEDIFIQGFTEVKASLADLSAALASSQRAAAEHVASLSALSGSLAPVASLEPACSKAEAAAGAAQAAAETAAAEAKAAAAEARAAAKAVNRLAYGDDGDDGDKDGNEGSHEGSETPKGPAAALSRRLSALERRLAESEERWGERVTLLHGAVEAVEQVLGTLVQVQLQQQQRSAASVPAPAPVPVSAPTPTPVAAVEEKGQDKVAASEVSVPSPSPAAAAAAADTTVPQVEADADKEAATDKQASSAADSNHDDGPVEKIAAGESSLPTAPVVKKIAAGEPAEPAPAPQTAASPASWATSLPSAAASLTGGDDAAPAAKKIAAAESTSVPESSTAAPAIKKIAAAESASVPASLTVDEFGTAPSTAPAVAAALAATAAANAGGAPASVAASGFTFAPGVALPSSAPAASASASANVGEEDDDDGSSIHLPDAPTTVEAAVASLGSRARTQLAEALEELREAAKREMGAACDAARMKATNEEEEKAAWEGARAKSATLAARTVLMYLRNILRDPQSTTYRRINASNSSFRTAIKVPGIERIFTALGFELLPPFYELAVKPMLPPSLEAALGGASQHEALEKARDALFAERIKIAEEIVEKISALQADMSLGVKGMGLFLAPQ